MNNLDSVLNFIEHKEWKNLGIKTQAIYLARKTCKKNALTKEEIRFLKDVGLFAHTKKTNR